MSFKALDTAERLWRLLLDYRYAQEKDPKWEQMIYLWRGLTLKQILENERTVKPLTHFPLKNKSFSTKLFSWENKSNE